MGPALDVRAERWTVHDLDFLELSIVVEVEAAQAAQAALIAFVERKELQPSMGEAGRPRYYSGSWPRRRARGLGRGGL